MKLLFACYKFSPAAVSAGIRWWSHSLYSHVAIAAVSDAGVVLGVYEAVEAGFVRAESLLQNHPSGIAVDLFEYCTPPPDVGAGFAQLEALVGQRYDYSGIASFITGGAIPENPCRVFCSEAAALCAQAARAPLQNLNPSSMLPRDVAMSLALRWKETITL